jgi:hypothetical protein
LVTEERFMKSQAKAVVLTALVLALALSSLSALRGQQQGTHPLKEQQSDDEPLPVVDYSDRSHEKDAKRRAKGKRYDDGAVQKEGWKNGAATHFNDWEVGLPALPTGQSDLVVVGTVLDARAHLSPDNTGVYSEFVIKVDEVLKDSGTSVSVGDTVAVEREGGRVRYPSGDIVRYEVSGQGMPRVNKRYVLFLKRGEDNLSILTGYELQGGKSYALDHPEKFRKFTGSHDASLINQIRSAIDSPAPAPSATPETGR